MENITNLIKLSTVCAEAKSRQSS